MVTAPWAAASCDEGEASVSGSLWLSAQLVKPVAYSWRTRPRSHVGLPRTPGEPRNLSPIVIV